LIQARIWAGKAERTNFVRVRRPPEEAPLIDKVSTLPPKE
jgi:hypothetical protein